MLFKLGERSENCVFGLDYNRSLTWKFSLESRLWNMETEFSGLFEWNDWFCLYSSWQHWKNDI
jgi:hypothetical protein